MDTAIEKDLSPFSDEELLDELKERYLESRVDRLSAGYKTFLLYEGAYYDFLEPDADTFSIEGIAKRLSKICRYTGSVHEFYSVAEHSVLAAEMAERFDVSAMAVFQALMHDAPEHVLNDLSSPLKSLLPFYRVLEKITWDVICEKFDMPTVMHRRLKEIDQLMYEWERTGISYHEKLPNEKYRSQEYEIEAWPPQRAEKEFLSAFDRYSDMKER